MLMLPVATIHHILKGHHNYRQSLKKLYYHPQHSVASHNGAHVAVFKISP